MSVEKKRNRLDLVRLDILYLAMFILGDHIYRSALPYHDWVSIAAVIFGIVLMIAAVIKLFIYRNN